MSVFLATHKAIFFSSYFFPLQLACYLLIISEYRIESEILCAFMQNLSACALTSRIIQKRSVVALVTFMTRLVLEIILGIQEVLNFWSCLNYYSIQPVYSSSFPQLLVSPPPPPPATDMLFRQHHGKSVWGLYFLFSWCFWLSPHFCILFFLLNNICAWSFSLLRC